MFRQSPFVRAMVNVAVVGPTTIIPVPTVGRTIRVWRMLLNAAGAVTIDLQDTGGTSLWGGAWNFVATQSNLMYPLDGYAMFTLPTGLGMQMLLGSTVIVRGWMDYTQQLDLPVGSAGV